MYAGFIPSFKLNEKRVKNILKLKIEKILCLISRARRAYGGQSSFTSVRVFSEQAALGAKLLCPQITGCTGSSYDYLLYFYALILILIWYLFW